MRGLQAGISYKAQAMSDLNYNKVIPPSNNTGPKIGHLTISIDNLTFFSSSKPSCIAKIQFWGAANPIYIPIQSSETFTVIASLVKFKHYLIDSKATQIEIVDSRNYKPIAFAYLNWLTHLRPMEDKQIYVDNQDGNNRDKTSVRAFYLPFYDQQIKETLPVYHYTAQSNPRKEEKLGELMITFQCRIYQVQQDGYISSNPNSTANIYNVRVSEASYKKNESPSLSICQIDIPEDGNLQLRTNKTIFSRHQSGLSPKIYATQYPHARKSHISILDNLGQLRKVKEQPEITEKSKTYDRMKVTGELQLQLIRMRLQMEDLVGTGKKVETISLEIQHFEPISKLISSKDVTHLDIKCQCREKFSHWRIFPQSQQEKTQFNSALSIKQGSLLTFIVGMKKGKDTYKGNVTIDSIRDSYDVNVLSSQGSIVGYIRVKIDRKTEISIVPQALQQKNIQKQQNQKIEFPPPVKVKKIVQEVNKNVQQAPQLPQEPIIESYFFFIIQEMNQSKSRNLNYKIFDMTINDFNPQKFLFISQREVAGKPMSLSIQHNSTIIYQQTLIPILRPTSFTSYNLICSLIFQKRVQQFQINCQLYVGNLQQINYFIQSLMQPRKEAIEPQLQRTIPIRIEQSNKNSIVAHNDKRNKQEKRKMKTQAIGLEQRDRRLTEEKVSGESVAMQKYQMHSQNQANDDENIYLVDLLTRFLDSMPDNLLPEVQEMPKEQFLQLVGSKSTIFQLELIDIIVSIFQENNNDFVSVTHISQCYKAYKSFFNIYIQQRQAVIKQILQFEPKAAQRIRNNSQLGTLNESMLWGRALSKVKDSSLKQKINKFYKISSFGTTDSAFLLQDLQLKEKELRSLDISNLGMLIKEWVEDFITKADLQNILNLKEKLLSFGQDENYLNIRSVGEIIQASLQLRLSLWQSLMLIQEIKGSYGCDLELQQGIISGASLLSWIDGVHKRSKVKSENSRVSESQVSLDPQELALIKQINQHHNRNNSDQFKRNSNRVSESKSALAANDSDIVDIANLLREKDGFLHFDLIDQTKAKHVRERKEENQVGKQLVLEEINMDNNFQIIENKRIKDEPLLEQQVQKKPQQPKKPKEKQSAKEMEFYLQIRQLKIYNESTQPPLLKAIFLLDSSSSQTQQHFYYLTSRAKYSQANKQAIRYLVDRKSKTQQKGIKCILQDEEGAALLNGFLPIEEINDWFMKNQEECKRTILMYTSHGKIGGKFAINILLKNRESKERTEVEEKIYLNIESIVPQLKNIRLFAQINDDERKEMMTGADEQLTLKEPIYHCQLIISDQQNSLSSIISLEQLYLKGIIQQSYPLIDCNAGRFIATLFLKLTYDSRRMNGLFADTQPKINQQLQSNIQKEPVSGTTVFLITEMATISYKNEYTLTPKLQCLIYRRGSSQNKQKVALVTPQFTLFSSELPNKYSFKQQKIQLQSQNEHSFLQFKLIENGKPICYSQKIQISQLKNGLNSNMIILTTTGDIKANFAIMFKKCELPLQKYALRRIVDCLNDFPINVRKDKISYLIKEAKIVHNLTFTEQNMLKDICEANLNQYNYLIVKGQILETSFRFLVEYPDTESKLLASTLINEFLYFDVQKSKRFTGELQKKQLLQILSSLTDTMHQSILDELSDTIKLLSTKGISTVNYLWIILILYCKGQTQSLEAQEKKMLASQIDTIYQSLKIRYG